MVMIIQMVLSSCLTLSASQSSNSVSIQSYRKIDFQVQVWNLFSSDKTEEVTIVPHALNSGTIECGVACHKDPECGGFLYDKTAGSCTMKLVKTFTYSNFVMHCFTIISLCVCKNQQLLPKVRNLWQFLSKLKDQLHAWVCRLSVYSCSLVHTVLYSLSRE